MVNLYAEKPGSLSPLDIATAQNFVANASKSLKPARNTRLRETAAVVVGAISGRGAARAEDRLRRVLEEGRHAGRA